MAKQQLMMKILLLAGLLGFTFQLATAATCTYDQSANTVSCRGISCKTVGQVQGGKLPKGSYRIGTFYLHGRARTPWFNLYPKRSAGGYWDYYTKASELGCRGGFGLHPGSVSLGCITVTDKRCFDQIKAVVQRFPSNSFDVTECLTCTFGRCLRGTNTLRGRRYHTDLQVVS